MRILLRIYTVVVLLAVASGCCHFQGESSSPNTPEEIGAIVGSLLNEWNEETFRAIYYDPENVEQLKSKEFYCFRPMNSATSGDFQLKITQTEVDQNGNRQHVHFDLLFTGTLNIKRQEYDSGRTNLFDRGTLVLIRLNESWKLKEIIF